MSTNKADHLYDDMIEELDSITGGPIPEKLLGLIEEMYSLADVEAERLREEERYGVGGEKCKRITVLEKQHEKLRMRIVNALRIGDLTNSPHKMIKALEEG